MHQWQSGEIPLETGTWKMVHAPCCSHGGLSPPHCPSQASSASALSCSCTRPQQGGFFSTVSSAGLFLSSTHFLTPTVILHIGGSAPTCCSTCHLGSGGFNSHLMLGSCDLPGDAPFRLLLCHSPRPPQLGPRDWQGKRQQVASNTLVYFMLQGGCLSSSHCIHIPVSGEKTV